MLVWLLVAAVIGFTFYVRRHEHLVAPWRRVAHSKSGMVGLVVLVVFVVIGLLDSLHFRPRLATQAPAAPAAYAVEVLSVLDVLCGPLRKRVEKTYSAPLAADSMPRKPWSSPTGARRASTRASSTAARISKIRRRIGRRT